MLSQTYPAAHGLLDATETAGDTHTYGFDLMGRPKTMNSTAPSGAQTPWISDVSYNESSQPTAISTTNPQVNAEARVYNALGQMTSLTSGAYRQPNAYCVGPGCGEGLANATSAMRQMGANPNDLSLPHQVSGIDCVYRREYLSGGH